jgi:hypothetical protein
MAAELHSAKEPVVTGDTQPPSQSTPLFVFLPDATALPRWPKARVEVASVGLGSMVLGPALVTVAAVPDTPETNRARRRHCQGQEYRCASDIFSSCVASC